ncbi:MAG: hypothetical protein WCK39_11530, partial [Methanomassiliicoccales archaeon]
IPFLAPSQPGDHYILIAFRPEHGGAEYLASSTYSLLPAPVWGDGNDLNRLNATQLAAAEKNGRIEVHYLIAEGEYATIYVPCAVIRVQVNDEVPPQTTATIYGTQGDDGWYTSSVSVGLGPSDLGSGVARTYFRLDDGPVMTYSGMPLGIVTEGMHTLRYWSVDLMGNVEAERVRTLRIDTTPPSASIVVQATAFQGHDGYDLRPPTIILSAADEGSGPGAIYYRYDEGVWQTYSGQFLYALTTSSMLSVMAVDAAGNEAAPITRWVKVDAIPPTVIPVLQGHQGSGQWYDAAVLVDLTVSEIGSGTETIWYSLDGVTFSNFTEPFWVNDTGIYHLWARASDVAGNIGDATTKLLLVDRSLPEVTADIDGDQGMDIWWNGSVVVRLSAQDVGSGIASILYRLDGGNWAIYADPFVISGEGRHNLSLRGMDRAGNQAVQVDRPVGIDSGSPAGSLDFAAPAAPSGWFLSHPVPIINITDAVSGPGRVTLLVDGVDVHYQAGMALQMEGTHALRYRVSDAAGNSGPWQEISIQIDTLAPTTAVLIDGPQGLGGWYTGDVQVLLTPAENGSGLAG